MKNLNLLVVMLIINITLIESSSGQKIRVGGIWVPVKVVKSKTAPVVERPYPTLDQVQQISEEIILLTHAVTNDDKELRLFTILLDIENDFKAYRNKERLKNMLEEFEKLKKTVSLSRASVITVERKLKNLKAILSSPSIVRRAYPNLEQVKKIKEEIEHLRHEVITEDKEIRFSNIIDEIFKISNNKELLRKMIKELVELKKDIPIDSSFIVLKINDLRKKIK